MLHYILERGCHLLGLILRPFRARSGQYYIQNGRFSESMSKLAECSHNKMRISISQTATIDYHKGNYNFRVDTYVLTGYLDIIHLSK